MFFLLRCHVAGSTAELKQVLHDGPSDPKTPQGRHPQLQQQHAHEVRASTGRMEATHCRHHHLTTSSAAIIIIIIIIIIITAITITIVIIIVILIHIRPLPRLRL